MDFIKVLLRITHEAIFKLSKFWKENHLFEIHGIRATLPRTYLP